MTLKLKRKTTLHNTDIKYILYMKRQITNSFVIFQHNLFKTIQKKKKKKAIEQTITLEFSQIKN